MTNFKRKNDFDIYQEGCLKTAKYSPESAISYCTLGLSNESGEVAGKVKKSLRGDYNLDDKKREIAKELGDVLWYLATLSKELGYSLSQVAAMNSEKLLDRDSRGVILGDGDNR